jgi:hypothetical protein
MSDRVFEPKLITFVSDDDMSVQFEDFGDLVVCDARLVEEMFGTILFNVRIRIFEDFSVGRIGALLLWMNEFGFKYLGQVSSSFRVNPTVPFVLRCNDVSNYFQVRTPEDFSKLIASKSEDREFFMEDEDHRYMMGQLAEDWRQPEFIRVHVEIIGVDGAFGTFENKGDIRYEESLSNWKLTNPKKVVLEDYEKRLRHQAPQNF